MAKKRRSEKHDAAKATATDGEKKKFILNVLDSSRASAFVDSGVVRRHGAKPRILFAAGDADDAYTDSKIWRLSQRLREQTGWDVIGVTTDDKVAEEGKKLGLPVEVFNIESSGVSTEQRLAAAGELIDTTADLLIPGSDLHLWRLLALDDFVGSLLLHGAQPTSTLDADLVILPLMSVDNNSKGACGLYTWMVSQARRQGIPVIGLEVSPLGNKTTLSLLPATHYAVKSRWGKEFLVRQGIATPSQVSVLRWEEAYLLWAGRDEYTEAYLEKEAQAREMLKTPPDRFVIVITHHVNMMWEVRKTLAALSRLPGHFTVVIRVNPATFRRQYPERDMVLKAYERELVALPHVMIDERVGVGLLLQLADLLISPFAGTTTERAVFCQKPTIICQAMGESGWQGEHIYWEPDPDKIPHLIEEWKARGVFGRTSLVQIARRALASAVDVARPMAEQGELTL